LGGTECVAVAPAAAGVVGTAGCAEAAGVRIAAADGIGAGVLPGTTPDWAAGLAAGVRATVGVASLAIRAAVAIGVDGVAAGGSVLLVGEGTVSPKEGGGVGTAPAAGAAAGAAARTVRAAAEAAGGGGTPIEG